MRSIFILSRRALTNIAMFAWASVRASARSDRDSVARSDRISAVRSNRVSSAGDISVRYNIGRATSLGRSGSGLRRVASKKSNANLENINLEAARLEDLHREHEDQLLQLSHIAAMASSTSVAGTAEAAKDEQQCALVYKELLDSETVYVLDLRRVLALMEFVNELVVEPSDNRLIRQFILNTTEILRLHQSVAEELTGTVATEAHMEDANTGTTAERSPRDDVARAARAFTKLFEEHGETLCMHYSKHSATYHDVIDAVQRGKATSETLQDFVSKADAPKRAKSPPPAARRASSVRFADDVVSAAVAAASATAAEASTDEIDIEIAGASSTAATPDEGTRADPSVTTGAKKISGKSGTSATPSPQRGGGGAKAESDRGSVLAGLPQTGTPLLAAIYRPIKRVMDYSFFFIKSQQHTPEDDPHFGALRDAAFAARQTAERVNVMMGDTLNKRDALLNKVRVLTHDVKGKLPLDVLLSSSRAFVRELSLEMQLVGDHDPLRMSTVRTSDADSLASSQMSNKSSGSSPSSGSGSKRKSVRRSMGITTMARRSEMVERRAPVPAGPLNRRSIQAAGAAQRALDAERVFGRERFSCSLYVFSDVIMLAKHSRARGCLSTTDIRPTFTALFELEDVSVERPPVASEDNAATDPQAQLIHRGVAHRLWAESETDVSALVDLIAHLKAELAKRSSREEHSFGAARAYRSGTTGTGGVLAAAYAEQSERLTCTLLGEEIRALEAELSTQLPRSGSPQAFQLPRIVSFEERPSVVAFEARAAGLVGELESLLADAPIELRKGGDFVFSSSSRFSLRMSQVPADDGEQAQEERESVALDRWSQAPKTPGGQAGHHRKQNRRISIDL